MRLARLPCRCLAIATLVAASGLCADAEPAEAKRAPVKADACLSADVPPVRARSAVVWDLIVEGSARSATFAAVICELSTSDVVAYVEPPSSLPANVDGYLVFLSSTSAKRYVLIRLSNHLSYPRIIALIGHELQHALEIARHPEVVDGPSLTMMYQRIGRAAGQQQAWDSDEAILVGSIVARELSAGDAVDADER